MAKKTTPKYCRKCGAKLTVQEYPADKVEQLKCYPMDCLYSTLGAAYDQNTGKRNMVEVHVCPEFKRSGIFKQGDNGHDILTVQNGYVDYGYVRIKC